MCKSRSTPATCIFGDGDLVSRVTHNTEKVVVQQEAGLATLMQHRELRGGVKTISDVQKVRRMRQFMDIPMAMEIQRALENEGEIDRQCRISVALEK